MPPSRSLASACALAALTAGVLLLPALASAQEPPPWPMAGGDPRHSGEAPGPAPGRRRSWAAEVGERGAVAGPAVGGGRVVVAGWNSVASFDAETGEPAWEIDREPGPAGVPAVTAQAVIFGAGTGAEDSALVAVSPEDGSQLWRRSLTSPAVASPTIGRGVVYMATRLGEVVAVELATGRTVWRAVAPGRVESSPAVSAGLVVVVAEDYDVGTVTVLALDENTGERRWRFVPEGVALGSSAVTIADGTVVLGIGDLRIHGLRFRDGKQKWTLRGRAAYGARFTPAGGAGVIGDRLGHVTSLDPASGEERWLYRVPGDLLLGGPVVLGGRWVAVGDGSGELTIIDARSGRLAWRTDLGTRRVEALASDGERLFAAQRGGPLVAFEHDPKEAILDEPSPTTLFPLRALAAWAMAAAPLYLVIVLLFRAVGARSAGRTGREEPEVEGWRP